MTAALDGRELLLEGGAGRVRAAAVLVAAAQPAEAVLHEGRGEVQRRHDGARDGVEVLSGVDHQAVEALHVVGDVIGAVV